MVWLVIHIVTSFPAAVIDDGGYQGYLHLQSQAVHVGVQENLCKGDKEGEDEVDIDHLDIGGWREAVTDLGTKSYQYSCFSYIH